MVAPRTFVHVRAQTCTIRRVLTEERRVLILDRLRTQGRVLAADLTAELAVSPDTVRRDLRELDEAGLLRRVHGGALPRHGDASPFANRARRAPAAKASIARRAAECVSDGDVIVLDGGRRRSSSPGPSATTSAPASSPPARRSALALADHPGLEITVVGGTLRRNALVTVGAAAVEALR